MAGLLRGAGFAVRSSTVRERVAEHGESAPQAFLLARKDGWAGQSVDTDTLRIEVSDARGERALRFLDGRPEDECGRGLVIVQVLARLWGVAERDVGKTVWAELSLSARRRPCPRRRGPAG